MKGGKVGIRCPTCGRAAMVRRTRDVEARAGRKVIVVRGIEVEECSRCGERLYDLTALRRIREARQKGRRGRAA